MSGPRTLGELLAWVEQQAAPDPDGDPRAAGEVAMAYSVTVRLRNILHGTDEAPGLVERAKLNTSLAMMKRGYGDGIVPWDALEDALTAEISTDGRETT